MGTPTPLSGPDLALGVATVDVPQAGVLLGHAFDEAILLSRDGDAFSAVGATCSHYGAPLAEGLCVDHTVRCPWHHACFDLRTGEVLRAPALRPLPRFETRVEGDRVRVIGTARTTPRRRAPGGPEPVVIVGDGAAGAAAVETLRQEGFEGRIELIGREPGPPVDRPNLSKDWLAGKAPEAWLPLREVASYAELGVTLRHAEVVALEPEARRVVLADGTALAYGACLLATGAEPVRLPIPGAERALTLRSLADARAMAAAATGARQAVVLGASFLGLEVAASLVERGLTVHVAAPEPIPLARVLGPELGRFLRDVHERRGVVFHLGCTATAIGEEVALSDGTRLPADLVVAAVGVRPSLGLAERAGLAVDGGVLVDELLRTSAPDVWAAGDVARWPDPHTGERQRIEHWALAQRQGQTAARNVLGHGERFDAVPFFWSAHHDVVVNFVGFPGGERIDRLGDPEEGRAAFAYRRGETTLALATVGDDALCLEAERLLEQDDHAGLARLVPVG
jgi:NADPH-dependent 2,4-dienoyl-CoA reductase/sulfur reductase-like enzyme/nitrite reductase/ring-hydroxylating ferredoxin subunit